MPLAGTIPATMDPRFDPNAPAPRDSGLFGLPPMGAACEVHVLPVPFEATTSFRRGCAHGPAAILAASHQVDLYDRQTGTPYERGIRMDQIPAEIERWNEQACTLAARAHDPTCPPSERDECIEKVNAISEQVNGHVARHASSCLERGELPVVLGGDHSVPLGAMIACAQRFQGMGVLHFDAHADLREAYEGFTYSHASIIHNLRTRASDLGTLVQVGVRDLGSDEAAVIEGARTTRENRIITLFDDQWARARFEAGNLRDRVRRTLDALPENVYVSFDVDGLDPSLCPQTGTPVPGGLTWSETMLWLEELANSGRTVVGLDLCEVSAGPGGDPKGESWDATVGARLLYRLIGTALLTRPALPC